MRAPRCGRRRTLGASALVGATCCLGMASGRGDDTPVVVTNVVLPSWQGSAGLFRMPIAQVGWGGGLRLGLSVSHFRTNSFFATGDREARTRLQLGGGYSPHRNIEVFSAIAVWRNDVWPSPVATNQADVSRNDGRWAMGAKVAGAPHGGKWAIGGEAGLGLRLVSAVLTRGASSWIDGLLSWTDRPAANILVRMHLLAGFILDRSRNQADQSGLSLSVRQRESFAADFDSTRVRLALGVDAPMEVTRARLWWAPIAEYHWEIVTADGDPAFADQRPQNRDRHWLTVGARAHVGARVYVSAAVDIAVRAAGYGYGPPLPPYDLTLAAAYPIGM